MPVTNLQDILDLVNNSLNLWQYPENVSPADEDIFRLDKYVTGQPTPYETEFITFENLKTAISGATVPTPTGIGDIPYSDDGLTFTILSAGSDNQLLKLASGVPIWGTTSFDLLSDTPASKTAYALLLSDSAGTNLAYNSATNRAGYVALNDQDTNPLTVPVGSFWGGTNDSYFRNQGGTSHALLSERASQWNDLLTQKVTPTTSDVILIEDAADSGAKKWIAISSLPGGGGGTTFDALTDTPASKIAQGIVIADATGTNLAFNNATNPANFLTLDTTPGTVPNNSLWVSANDAYYRNNAGTSGFLFSERASQWVDNLTIELTPSSSDYVLLEDFTTGVKKYTGISLLPISGGGTTFDSLTDTPASKIAQGIVVADSAGTNLAYNNATNPVNFITFDNTPGTIPNNSAWGGVDDLYYRNNAGSSSFLLSERVGQLLDKFSFELAPRSASDILLIEEYSTGLKYVMPMEFLPRSVRLYKKEADEIVNNSTTMQDDNDIQGITLEANTNYAIEMFLRVTQAATGAQFNAQFVTTNSCTFAIGAIANINDNVINTYNYSVTTGTTKSGIVAATMNLANLNNSARINGTINCGASAATLKLQWAQYAATANNTTLGIGSYLKITKES